MLLESAESLLGSSPDFNWTCFNICWLNWYLLIQEGLSYSNWGSAPCGTLSSRLQGNVLVVMAEIQQRIPSVQDEFKPLIL